MRATDLNELDAWLYARKRASGGAPEKRRQMGAETLPSGQDLSPVKHSFRDVAQRLFWKQLDAWQLDLCDRLQRVYQSRSRRVLIHCMPQVGKTILVSQRFPAYCIGENPMIRVRLLMYNLQHARDKGGRQAKTLLQSATFGDLYPDPKTRLPKLSRAEQWSTLAREAIGDGQSSFKCFGLDTGATGEGGDLWLFDDPYPSAAEADSKAYNERVWNTWENTVSPRLGEHDNVVIMFHRYSTADFAGQLLTKEAGQWELWRYPAIADGPYKVEETEQEFPAFPLWRQPGEYLSQRYSPGWYESKRTKPRAWRGQFQGRPTDEDGDIFDLSVWRQPGMVVEPEEVPPGLPTVRAWDFAATEGGGAFSAGVKMCGPDRAGIYYVLDSRTAQKSTANRQRLIRQTAEHDGDAVEVGIPKDPGSAGTDTVYFSAQELAGFRWWSYPARQDKVTRVRPFADACNAGIVKLVRGDWVAKYKAELQAFPYGEFKDQADASGDAFKRLSRRSRRGKHESHTSSSFDA